LVADIDINVADVAGNLGMHVHFLEGTKVAGQYDGICNRPRLGEHRSGRLERGIIGLTRFGPPAYEQKHGGRDHKQHGQRDQDIGAIQFHFSPPGALGEPNRRLHSNLITMAAGRTRLTGTACHERSDESLMLPAQR
jgi:hypothetical protein